MTTDAPLPPLLEGRPLLGSAIEMGRAPLKLLLAGYEQLGPIFRVRALHRRFTVLAGVEANRFVAKLGDGLLAEPDYRPFAEEMDTRSFILAMDGPRHAHMRKLLKRGFSPGSIVEHIPYLVRTTRALARSWQPGEVIDIIPALRELVTRQLGVSLMNREPSSVGDMQTFISTIMKTRILGTRPSVMLKLPPYTGAKARLHALSDQVVREHREQRAGAGERARDFIDDLFDAVDLDGQPLAEDVFRAVVIGTFLAGLDTVAITTSFVLYNLVRYPSARDRLAAEVDALFDAADPPSVDDFKRASVLRAVVLETLRLNPVIAFVSREAKRDFEFAGYRVEGGSKVLVASVVPHFRAEHYPAPARFDIDRYIAPRREHRRPGVYTPYGVGPHTCLGAGFGELQVMVLVATLVRYAQLEFADPDYTLQIILEAARRPDKHFKLRLVSWRSA